MLTLHRLCWKLQSASEGKTNWGFRSHGNSIYLQRNPRQSLDPVLGGMGVDIGGQGHLLTDWDSSRTACLKRPLYLKP